jgi:dephospho-CoA kinase
MIIGLTGNSGSGKSNVAAILQEEFGAHIIDADKIAHGVLLKSGQAYDEVVAGFGEDILNSEGEIDRRKLGALIFESDRLRGLLTKITHKYIVAEMLAQLEQARHAYPHVVMDAPLLVEAGLHKASDTVWLVYAPPDVKMKRIIARDGLTEAEAHKRITSQTDHNELTVYADVVIENSGSQKELRAKVRHTIATYRCV